MTTPGPGRLSALKNLQGDENGQASGMLANNLPADNAGNRFHGALYRADVEFGQEGGEGENAAYSGSR
jgi:hypothetical protein